MGARQVEPDQVFDALKPLLSRYASNLVVTRDDENEYYLDTRYVMKNGKNLFFGAVQVNKRYVSYHLMPVYVNPSLLESISDSLRKRMHGKSCFNFTRLDQGIIEELSALTESGFLFYTEKGYIESDNHCA